MSGTSDADVNRGTSGAQPAEAPAVLHELRGQVFWITINRPDKRNAINADVIAGIRDGYRLAHADPQVRAIVLTASGTRAFCAGGDLQPAKGFAFDLSRPNVANRIVDKSPTAIRRGKYAMCAIEAMSFDQAIAYTESQIALLAMTDDRDAREGMVAFNEKRKPVWTGR